MTSTIIPALRYRDARRAVAWLQEAFDFTPTLVVEGPDGGIAHAELVSGSGMLMLGSASSGGYGDLVATVDDAHPPTAGIYVIVEDVDAHAARARAAGAEIVIAPVDEDYGGRGYSCRDFEGNVWSFGSYDPWTEGEG